MLSGPTAVTKTTPAIESVATTLLSTTIEKADLSTSARSDLFTLHKTNPVEQVTALFTSGLTFTLDSFLRNFKDSI